MSSSTSAPAPSFGSSSRKSVYMRAPSPAAQAASMAAVTGSDVGSVAAFATRAIATATTLDDVIVTIPSNFRLFIAPLLRSMRDVHNKLCNAQSALASLHEHQTNGTWPPYIAGMHNPFESIQPAKEARPSLSASLTENNIWFKGVREQALLKVIEMKQAEVESLAKTCSPPTIELQILTSLKSDRVKLERALGDHVLPPAADGTKVQTGVKMAQFMIDDYELATELAPVWVAKCWDFTRIKSQRSEALVAQKKNLVATASDPMDLDPPNLERLVKEAVESALRTKTNGPRTDTRKRAQGKGSIPANKKKPAPAPGKKGPKSKVTKTSNSSSANKNKRPRVPSGKKSGPPMKKNK